MLLYEWIFFLSLLFVKHFLGRSFLILSKTESRMGLQVSTPLNLTTDSLFFIEARLILTWRLYPSVIRFLKQSNHSVPTTLHAGIHHPN
jgi:hypothetical protein